ncbi:hypothetical protein EVAR_67247_1 [Eumeta japonica]|uniref:Uncharacterized protein n=1 Tax=Eumeta variegata TaxID=151549 RepID=A0A4C1YU59_EUMVA|nr:hypothetical protein EVAR_67247_1 [Eumeta japonica]
MQTTLTAWWGGRDTYAATKGGNDKGVSNGPCGAGVAADYMGLNFEGLPRQKDSLNKLNKRKCIPHPYPRQEHAYIRAVAARRVEAGRCEAHDSSRTNARLEGAAVNSPSTSRSRHTPAAPARAPTAPPGPPGRLLA